MYLARHRRKPQGRWALGTALAAAVLCAGGAAATAFGLFDTTPADAGATWTPASVTTTPPRLTHDPGAKPLARSVPASIRIPDIRVDAPVMEVGRNADGTVQVFDVYRVTVTWDGRLRTLTAEAVDPMPLVGMALLHGYDLRIRVMHGGGVVLEAVP